MTLVLRYAARSDRGLVRGNNEDSVYAGPRLLALADGMGGHAAGEVASQLIITALAPLDDDEPGGDVLAALESATLAGNAQIADAIEAEPDLDGMGTTLTAMLFTGTRLGLIHVGDSRAYLLREGRLTQITRDDTFVQSLIDQGRITTEQAKTHPQRSLIMRALTGHEVEPTLTMREVRAGDRYLLCSDGLSDVVSHETITETLSEGDQDECADVLIELALRSGGPDNITVIVADVIDLDYGQSNPIIGGAVSGEADEDLRTDTAAGRAAAIRPPAVAPRRIPAAPEPEPPARNRLRGVLIGVALLALVVLGVIVSTAWIRSYYYVGESDGTVVVHRGLPGSFVGIDFHGVSQVGCVSSSGVLRLVDPGTEQVACELLTVEDLQPSARQQVISGLPSGSRDDAVRQMRSLVENDLLPPCTPAERDQDEDGAAAPGRDGAADPDEAGDSAPEAPGAEDGQADRPDGEADPDAGDAEAEAADRGSDYELRRPGQTCRVVD